MNPKICSHLYMIFCLLLPVFLSAQGYVNLSQTSAMSELPFIIVRPNGEILVAWTDGGHYNSGGALWYCTYTASTGWSQPHQFASATSAYPQLALDGAGNVHLACWEGAGSYWRDIYYRKYSNGSWSDGELVYDSLGYNSSWPRIDVDGNTIYILWSHNHTNKASPMDVVLNEKPIGGAWPAQYQDVSQHPNSTSIHVSFKVKNGVGYAAWQDDNHYTNNWNIYYSERRNGSWSEPQQIYPGGNQYQCALDVDNSGGVHVIYSGRSGPIYYMKKSGSAWSTPQIISTAYTDITTHNFIKFAQGMLHAVWRQREGSGNYIFYCKGSPSGQWDPPIKVSHGGESEYPVLDVDRQGQVHIVYSDIGVGGQRDIFYVQAGQVTSYPVAAFTATPTSGNPPLLVSFDASASYDPDGQITSYAWDFGNGSQGSGIQTSHTYTVKGTYAVTLTVTDDEQQASSASQTITVGTPPVAKFTATPTSGKSPLLVFFNASESYDPDGSIVSYTWDFGDGTFGSGVSVDHTYTQLATRTAILTVKDNEGLEASASVDIHITSSPVAKFKHSPKKGRPPLKVNFDASSSKPADPNSGWIDEYEWDFGDGKKGSGEKTSHTYSTPGSYVVTLKITDNQGYVDSTTGVVEVFSNPVASFTCSPQNGIAPLIVMFDASASYDMDGKIRNYKWLFGEGTTSQGKKVSHTYANGGKFTVTLTVTDNDGWTDSATKTIEVIGRPFPPGSLSVQNIVHEGLFFSNYINIFKWHMNEKNTGKIAVSKYLIFRKKKGTDQDFMYIGEVDSSVFEFIDQDAKDKNEMLIYVYGVRAVDGFGRESDMAASSPLYK